MSDGNEKLYDFRKRSDAAATVFRDPSLTNQSEKDDADINVIVRRFGITGEMPKGLRVPTYGDYSQVHDFRSALEAVERAEAEFMSMPADVRAQFDNDPGVFLDFASDPSNLDALGELGLAIPIEPPPQPTPPTTPPAAPTAPPAPTPT